MSQVVDQIQVKKVSVNKQRQEWSKKKSGSEFQQHINAATTKSRDNGNKKTSANSSNSKEANKVTQDKKIDSKHITKTQHEAHLKKKTSDSTENQQITTEQLQQLVLSIQQILHQIEAKSRTESSQSNHVSSHVEQIMNSINSLQMNPNDKHVILTQIKDFLGKYMKSANSLKDSQLLNQFKQVLSKLQETTTQITSQTAIKNVISDLTNLLKNMNHGQSQQSLPSTTNPAISQNGKLNKQPPQTLTNMSIVSSDSIKHSKTKIAKSALSSTDQLNVKSSAVLKKDNMKQIISFNSGPMHRLQQLMIHSQKLAQPINNESMIQQVQNALAKNGMLQFKNGAQQLTVNLHPDHLGELNIVITQDQSGISARITATTNEAKDLLQSQLGQLKQTFIAHNLPVNKIEVLGQSQQFNLMQQQQQSQQQQDQSQHHEHQDTQLHDDQETVMTNEDFSDWLRNGLQQKEG